MVDDEEEEEESSKWREMGNDIHDLLLECVEEE